MSEKVTASDLAIAVEWLRSYEGQDEHDDVASSMRKVADYLDREVHRRNEHSLARAIQRAHPNVSAKAAREYARLRAAEEQGEAAPPSS